MPAPETALDLRITVNGEHRDVRVAAHHTLLDVVRDEIGLTGTKECCAEGECGACTLLMDGHAVNSCLVLAAEADGHEITTIEALSAPGELSPIQDSFLRTGSVQCGFCIPGMVMSAHYLLAHNARPTEAEIREGLSGNLCRCGGYNQICAAVAQAAEMSSGEGEHPAGPPGVDSP